MDADERVWRGVHISALQTNLNRYQYPKLIVSDEHTILVKLPIIPGRAPDCYPSTFNSQDYWDETHVRLPCSDKNVSKNHKRRWDTIRETFANILSSQQLEAAILSYNHRYAELWDFSALHSFFKDVIDERESAVFFRTLFPKIRDLALCLPQLVTDGIPLLRQGYKHSVTLSQVQISCLLANAFLCTFPHRNWNGKNSEYSDYPDINFNRLFQCEDPVRAERVHEKLKCILNYFRRVTTSAPGGIVTYSRQFVPDPLFPNWLESNEKLPRLFVSSSGTIEDDGFGLFQVDFANKFVGGGVIGTGCVQEEIRFVACPELILSRLFTQVLGENEALVVTGCERFNRYRGYGQTFEWDGDYIDETPSDEYGRKYCTVIALDALCYQHNPKAQYMPENIWRDLNKAYVGFSWGTRRKKEDLCATATGNWGCGIFAGDPQLKSIIQLLAAGVAGRDLAYFTFGDTELRDSMADVYELLSENAVTIGRICKLLVSYNARKLYDTVGLFEFLKAVAWETEVSLDEKEHQKKLLSMSKTFEIFSDPKVAMNKESSLFCRTRKSETTNEVKNAENFGDFRALQGSSVNHEGDTNEERLKAKELRMFFNLYGTPEMSIQKDSKEFPEENSFESFDRFKLKMKNSFVKNAFSKHSEPVIIDKLERLGTNMSSQLTKDDKVKFSAINDPELEATVTQKDSTLCREEDLVPRKESITGINENINSIIKDKRNKENKIRTTQEPILATRVTLSHLSARLSKSTPNKNKNYKDRPSQRRKISDYFEPLNKNSNDA